MSKKDNKKFEELKFEIDIPQLLLHSRNILLHGAIDVNMTKRICEDLLGLNELSNEPIALWINSIGGSVDCGFSIIDTILGLSSPVYTFINGAACSMGALISIAGSKRVMTEHSYWMIHDLWVEGSGEWAGKEEARMSQYMKPRRKMMEKFIKSRTRLTNNDIEKSKITELHLWAKEAKEKGVVDFIAKKRRRK